jgi:hypothetical protein
MRNWQAPPAAAPVPNPGHELLFTPAPGCLWTGWQALLTVRGASLLASGPLLAIDLTGQHAAVMLTAAVKRTGIAAISYELPQDLGRCGMLSELSPAQLAAAVAEALQPRCPPAPAPTGRSTPGCCSSSRAY